MGGNKYNNDDSKAAVKLEKVKETYPLGEGPALEVVEKLPTPQEVFNVSKPSCWKIYAAMLGPAFIALGGAIGSGEWLLGPAVAAKYGLGLFWLVWIGVVLQTIYNIAFARVTAAIGEPALVYMARNKPRAFWIPFLTAALIIGYVWPGWALAAATGLGVFILGRVPGAEEAAFVRYLGMALFLLALLIVMIGGKIAATLELIFRYAVIFITISVFILALMVVTPEVWNEFLAGLVNIGYIPKGVDIFLLGGWWAYIAWASAFNYLLTNYYRDKGYGMSYLVGYIPAMIGGKKIELSATGKIFKITPENLATWRLWERLIMADQWLIFATFAFLGMVLPSIMVRSVVPLGTDLPAWGIAAHVANQFGARWGPIGFYFIAFIGFLILWTTQLQIMDMLTRNVTDILWSTSERVRRWAKGDVRRVYYAFFLGYTAFAMWAIWQAPPLVLLLISANIANFGGFYAWILLWNINRKLPKEIRLKWYYWPPIILFSAICMFFFISVFILGQLLGIKIF